MLIQSYILKPKTTQNKFTIQNQWFFEKFKQLWKKEIQEIFSPKKFNKSNNTSKSLKLLHKRGPKFKRRWGEG
jgi:hypothetical protein